MFDFHAPWFALLLPLPFFIRVFGKRKQDQESLELRFPALQRLEEAFTGFSLRTKSLNSLFLTILTLIWTLLIIALMQPEKVSQFKQIKQAGHDIVLAVDISASMQAVDFSTSSKVVSRLDATKAVVSQFVLGRQGDRVGLITFGEHAYLHVPLTLDMLSVSQMLNQTMSGMAGTTTAIGDAIGLSVRTLRERPEGSRVLILLTDGEDNASSIPPSEAAELAKQYGIRIYTIGVGQNGLVPFPTQSGGYGMVQVSIDEKLLQQIADLTGGQYFLATNQNMLASIYNKIDALEKTESDESLFLIRDPYYYYPLGLAMLLLLMFSLYQLLPRRAAHGS